MTVHELLVFWESKQRAVEVLCWGGGVCVAVISVRTRVAQPEPSRESGAIANLS